MRLNDSELNILRTRPISTTLDLFIFKPRVVMKCLLNNASAAKNDRTIPFDTVSFGNYSSVEAGMTLLVGTTEGGSELGKARIISATSSQFKVGENSNIKWQDNLYLTVIRYWDLWPVFPRIIQDPSNEENVIFYKDYDIPYSNQNYYLGTFVNAGPHRPIFLENGTGTAYYSSTGTYNLIGDNLTYSWAFEGGTPTGSTSANPGFVYYTGTGDFVTRLKVTDSIYGNVDTTYRYVSVRNRIGEGDNTPIVKWEMSTLSGSRDEAGYRAEIKVYDQDMQIDENSLVMIRADDWYGDIHQSLGGNYPNGSNIFFVGYIENGSIHYNAFYNFVQFNVTSVTGIMKKMSGFSVSVESKQNPAYWYELRDMDIKRAIYHYLKWHSTVLSVTDFSFVGDDRKIQYFDVDRTSVFDAIDNLMKSAVFGRVSSDRQGRLWADIDPLAYPNPTGTFVPVMDISKRDWMGEPTISEPLFDTTSYIEMGGIAYNGVFTGTFEALLSGAPGVSPSYHGGVEKISGLALTNQDQLNQLSGNLWANRNQNFPEVTMNMATPPRNLDIAPQEVVSIKINKEDTVRNEAIDKIYIPSVIGWSYSSEKKTLYANVEYFGVVSGDPGDTILIPVSVDETDFQFPDFSFPSFPPIYIPGLPDIPPEFVSNFAVHIKNYGIFYTNNFTDPEPIWTSANANLLLNVADFRNFEVGADGSMVVQVSNQSTWAKASPDVAWNLLLLADENVIGNPEDYPFPRNWAVSGFGLDRSTGKLLILAGLEVTIGSNQILYPYYGDIGGVIRTSETYVLPQFPANNFIYALHEPTGKWATSVFVANPVVYTLSENGTLVENTNEFADAATVISLVLTQSRYSPNVIMSKVSSGAAVTNFRVSTDAGASFVSYSGSTFPFREDDLALDRFESMITNEDGTQMVVASSQGIMGLVTSLDGGASWSSGTFGSSGTTSVWHLGGNSYVYGGGNNIYAIEDITNPTGTSISKLGNLRNLITGAFQVVSMRHW